MNQESLLGTNEVSCLETSAILKGADPQQPSLHSLSPLSFTLCRSLGPVLPAGWDAVHNL